MSFNTDTLLYSNRNFSTKGFNTVITHTLLQDMITKIMSDELTYKDKLQPPQLRAIQRLFRYIEVVRYPCCDVISPYLTYKNLQNASVYNYTVDALLDKRLTPESVLYALAILRKAPRSRILKVKSQQTEPDLSWPVPLPLVAIREEQGIKIDEWRQCLNNPCTEHTAQDRHLDSVALDTFLGKAFATEYDPMGEPVPGHVGLCRLHKDVFSSVREAYANTALRAVVRDQWQMGALGMWPKRGKLSKVKDIIDDDLIGLFDLFSKQMKCFMLHFHLLAKPHTGMICYWDNWDKIPSVSKESKLTLADGELGLL